MDDIMVTAQFPKTVDVPFATVTLIFLILFFLEQIARSIVQYQEYCFSFFW